MSGVEIRQRAASEGQRGGRGGQEGWPAPLYRASWSTDLLCMCFLHGIRMCMWFRYNF